MSDETQNVNQAWTWQQIEDALRGLRFGSVTLLVQDGVVVQVDRTDRRRYQRDKSDRAAPSPHVASAPG